MEDIQNAPLGPGAILANCGQLTPQGLLKVIRGDSDAQGRHIGGMTDSPTFTDEDEVQNLAENLVGISADLKGAIRRQLTTVMIECEIARMTEENFKLIRPDFEGSDWVLGDGAFARLSVGPGNAGILYTAATQGTLGNDTQVAHVVSGNNTPLSVAVPSGIVTVNLGTDGTGAPVSTADQVIAAVLALPAAAALLGAARATGNSTGGGTVPAQAATNLAGGVNPTVVGRKLRRRGFYKLTDYLDNVVLVLPRLDTPTGYIFVIENAMNRSDDFEYEPDDEGNISGVSLELVAHNDGTQMDPVTGELEIPYWIGVLDPVLTP